MKTYVVYLKVDGQLSLNLKAASLEAALEEAQSLYENEDAQEATGLKARKGVDVDWAGLKVIGVLE